MIDYSKDILMCFVEYSIKQISYEDDSYLSNYDTCLMIIFISLSLWFKKVKNLNYHN
jgi:hypothetical protein